MSSYPHVSANGDLYLDRRVHISAGDITFALSTSGGPGGQHANRSLTKVTAMIDVAASQSLSAHQKTLILEKTGPTVRASSSRFRSQAQNKEAALLSLAAKLNSARFRDLARRPTKATRASKVRRVDEKKRRGESKQLRRRPIDD
jgi:ribosome-associated protein